MCGISRGREHFHSASRKSNATVVVELYGHMNVWAQRERKTVFDAWVIGRGCASSYQRQWKSLRLVAHSSGGRSRRRRHLRPSAGSAGAMKSTRSCAKPIGNWLVPVHPLSRGFVKAAPVQCRGGFVYPVDESRFAHAMTARSADCVASSSRPIAHSAR